MIDLGSIAKGYCADLTKEILLSEGITEAFINYGGTVITIGQKRRIGIQDPFQKQGMIMGSIEAQNQAVVTSGNYEHYFMKGKKRYSHILDPRIGRPVDQKIASVTIVSQSALAADVYTTVLFIKADASLADELVIMNDGRYYMSKNLRKVFVKYDQ